MDDLREQKLGLFNIIVCIITLEHIINMIIRYICM